MSASSALLLVLGIFSDQVAYSWSAQLNATLNATMTTETDATEATVPDKLIPRYILKSDQHRKTPNESIAARLLKFDSSELGGEPTTDFPFGYFVTKWTLLVLLVFSPLVLLPILFLFAKGRGSQVKENEDGTEDDGMSPDGKQHLESWKHLAHPIYLWSTLSKQDPFLEDPSNQNTEGLVQVEKCSGEVHYFLDPDVSLQNTSNGLLYHPPSGLVFVPIHELTFQPEVRLYVNILDGKMSPPQPNHVFNRQTNKLYERCFALGYNVANQRFFIPRQPENQSAVVAIRQLTSEEVPEMYRTAYIEALKKEQGPKPKVPENLSNIPKEDFSKMSVQAPSPSVYLDAV